MSLKSDIIAKAKEIESTLFVVETTTSAPTISNSKLTFGCTGLEFDATVLYIDMRGSTAVLNTHRKRVVAKIHMLYYHAIVKIAKATCGEIRSFNGDSLLVFYPGNTKESISNAVCAAMQMKYAIKELLNENLKYYSNIDFGIGIDYGSILATKVGVGGIDETKDLIWIGNAVNKATKISDKCKSDCNIGISKIVYDNILDYIKYTKRNTVFGINNESIWLSSSMMYNENWELYYTTTYHCTID